MDSFNGLGRVIAMHAVDPDDSEMLTLEPGQSPPPPNPPRPPSIALRFCILPALSQKTHFLSPLFPLPPFHQVKLLFSSLYPKPAGHKVTPPACISSFSSTTQTPSLPPSSSIPISPLSPYCRQAAWTYGPFPLQPHKTNDFASCCMRSPVRRRGRPLSPILLPSCTFPRPFHLSPEPTSPPPLPPPDRVISFSLSLMLRRWLSWKNLWAPMRPLLQKTCDCSRNSDSSSKINMTIRSPFQPRTLFRQQLRTSHHQLNHHQLQ